MNRYFDDSRHAFISKYKVIVFPGGRSPGRSYWSEDPPLSSVRWSLKEMKEAGHKEITRAAARRLIKNIP